ncbi:inositol monophosphatase [Streptomyces sp. ICBB 8177]|uniref:inositol monophosphatase family protein n=1 Tax=Streptomyces sp. ICBB 8177 TaxID=563922 RepID=UPI000D678D43|nr:inositol monophosphatase [Streptomyces sp. ICBB 8177]PWI42723.1 inositol monophosphatase [Streptomyces sp. ICBB 8177]
MTDDELLAPMTALARRVGRGLVGRPLPEPRRTPAELVAAFAAVDAPVSAQLREELSELRPVAAWAEELRTELPVTGEAWVVDALDGAVQYLHGMPHWCVSLALVRDRVPVAAVLYAPYLDETYAAALGHGTTRDGVPVTPSAKTDPAGALLAFAHPPFVAGQPAAITRAGRALSAVLPVVGAVRNLGATSWQIADVAAGRLDGFVSFGVDDGNLLGAALLAREAGVRVTDTTGRPWRAGADGFLAAAPWLHGRLLEAIGEPDAGGDRGAAGACLLAAG